MQILPRSVLPPDSTRESPHSAHPVQSICFPKIRLSKRYTKLASNHSFSSSKTTTIVTDATIVHLAWLPIPLYTTSLLHSQPDHRCTSWGFTGALPGDLLPRGRVRSHQTGPVMRPRRGRAAVADHRGVRARRGRRGGPRGPRWSEVEALEDSGGWRFICVVAKSSLYGCFLK